VERFYSIRAWSSKKRGTVREVATPRLGTEYRPRSKVDSIRHVDGVGDTAGVEAVGIERIP
jgi:hypothetical protein